MTLADDADLSAAELSAADIAWDLDPLLGGRSIDALLDEADAIATELEGARGTVADLDAGALADFMDRFAGLQDVLGRAGNWASLRFAVDTADEARGAAVQRVQERATAVFNRLIFFELEWAALSDERVEELLADERLTTARHYLRSARRYRPHLLTEPEERLIADKRVTGAAAWSRLFNELTSAITVELPDESGDVRSAPLEEGLSQLSHPDRAVRRTAASAVTEGLGPGLRTRAFLFNTLVADKATDDRLRRYDSWLASRNLANEASDASVQALVEAVVGRYDIARRWYRLKASILGLDRLADYDRMASVSSSEIFLSESRRI